MISSFLIIIYFQNTEKQELSRFGGVQFGVVHLLVQLL